MQYEYYLYSIIIQNWFLDFLIINLVFNYQLKILLKLILIELYL